MSNFIKSKIDLDDPKSILSFLLIYFTLDDMDKNFTYVAKDNNIDKNDLKKEFSDILSLVDYKPRIYEREYNVYKLNDKDCYIMFCPSLFSKKWLIVEPDTEKTTSWNKVDTPNDDKDFMLRRLLNDDIKTDIDMLQLLNAHFKIPIDEDMQHSIICYDEKSYDNVVDIKDKLLSLLNIDIFMDNSNLDFDTYRQVVQFKNTGTYFTVKAHSYSYGIDDWDFENWRITVPKKIEIVEWS